MVPIGDNDRGVRSVPVATIGIIALNIIMFLLELNEGDPFIMKWAFVPSRFMSNPSGEFATLFTSMFMHAGLMHLGGNMLFLWIFGNNVEDAFGRLQYLLFYLVCGLAATFAQLAVSIGSGVPNLGASGAIAGVLGSYLVLFPNQQVKVLLGTRVVQVSAYVMLVGWIILQLVGEFASITDAASGGVAYMAHIGGFLAGVILTTVLTGRRLPLPTG